ncbi:MAG: restriction endonuclease [Spirochaetaceae bacterium]|nr:restriction endonuclease [Spirochaetaceae bacterium]MBP5329973.1 restriction endonuclease [Spirochaetaceae bacterium]
MVLPVIFGVLLISLIAISVFYFLSNQQKTKTTQKVKDKQTILREANRKLAQDPHNPAALKALADMYFSEHAWDKAFVLYDLMLEISSTHKEIDEVETGLRQGICAIEMGKHQDAFKGLVIARRKDMNNELVNYYLGLALYLNNDFEKAIPLVKKVLITNAENNDAYRLLGLAMCKGKKYRESLPYLKHAMDNNPEDKEILFCMAQSLAETNTIENALKIFIHLRPDPEYGAQACLQAGILHYNSNSFDKAIQDFEIGLKHTTAKLDVLTDIRYRLAQSYLKMQRISDSLEVLKEIESTVPGYKDVPTLISRYQELNQNKNLQTYLMATNSDFVSLCRNIALTYIPDARVKITNIESTPDNTEIMTEVDTGVWEDVIIFKFFRNVGTTGELLIRDFHSRIHETKAGQGICFTAGNFSEEAHKYIDGRPINLIEKNELNKVLSNLKLSPELEEPQQQEEVPPTETLGSL